MFKVYTIYVNEEPPTLAESMLADGIHLVATKGTLQEAIEFILMAYQIDQRNGKLGDWYYWCAYDGE